MLSDIPNQTKPVFAVFKQNRTPVLAAISAVIVTIYIAAKLVFDPQILNVTGIPVRNIGWQILIFSIWSFTVTLIGVRFRECLLITVPLPLGFYGLRFAPLEANDSLNYLSEIGFWIVGSSIIALLSTIIGYVLGTVVLRYR